MRDLDDALKSLKGFESLVGYGLYPGKSLEKVEHKDNWDSFNFAGLKFRVGRLTVEVHAHAADLNGKLNVSVWDFNNPSDEAFMFDMGSDVDHVASVVVDYLNEYEVAE